MSQDKPNMDEVKRMKEAYEPYRGKTGVPFVKAANDVLLLIEEREQLREQFTLAVRELTKEIEKTQRLEFEREQIIIGIKEYEFWIKNIGIPAVDKVAEQDKEIQLKNGQILSLYGAMQQIVKAYTAISNSGECEDAMVEIARQALR